MLSRRGNRPARRQALAGVFPGDPFLDAAAPDVLALGPPTGDAREVAAPLGCARGARRRVGPRVSVGVPAPPRSLGSRLDGARGRGGPHPLAHRLPLANADSGRAMISAEPPPMILSCSHTPTTTRTRR